MNERINNNVATNVDEFEPSLWTYIGQFSSRYSLIALVDQIHNDRMAGRNPEYPVVLLTGEIGHGRRTLARALHNAVGNLEFRETALILGTSEDHYSFFKTTTDFTTHYITNFTKVSTIVAGALIHIIRDKCFTQAELPGRKSEIIPVKNKLIILSTENNPTINPDVLKYVGIRCDLSGYNNDHIYQILKQKIGFLNWNVSEATLKYITQNTINNNPSSAVHLLQQSYVVSRSQNKDRIDITHAKKAFFLCT